MKGIINKLFKADEFVNVCISSPKESQSVMSAVEAKEVKEGKYC